MIEKYNLTPVLKLTLETVQIVHFVSLCSFSNLANLTYFLLVFLVLILVFVLEYLSVCWLFYRLVYRNSDLVPCLSLYIIIVVTRQFPLDIGTSFIGWNQISRWKKMHDKLSIFAHHRFLSDVNYYDCRGLLYRQYYHNDLA